MNLWRTTFIDEIIRRAESQASVGFQAIPGKSSTAIPQATGSPSAAHAEIQSQVGGSEQSFQAAISLPSDPLQEGKLCKLREGEGETSGTAKAGLEQSE